MAEEGREPATARRRRSALAEPIRVGTSSLLQPPVLVYPSARRARISFGRRSGSNGYCSGVRRHRWRGRLGATTAATLECPFYDSHWHREAGPQCECARRSVLPFDNRSVAFTTEAGAAIDLFRDGVCYASDGLDPSRRGSTSIRDGQRHRRRPSTRYVPAAKAISTGGFRTERLRGPPRSRRAARSAHWIASDRQLRLVVAWTDLDQNRVSSAGELTPLAEHADQRSISRRRSRARAPRRITSTASASGALCTLALQTRSIDRGIGIDVYLPTLSVAACSPVARLLL